MSPFECVAASTKVIMPFCKRDKKANTGAPSLKIVKTTPANEPTKGKTNEWCEPKQPQDKKEITVARLVKA